MAKNRRGGKLHRGPWTAAHIERELKRVGYVQVPGGQHICFEHPDRPGKVQVSRAWTGVKVGSDVFKGVAAQTGYGKDGLIRVLNGLDP